MSNVSAFTRDVDFSLITKLFMKFNEVYGSVWSNRMKNENEWLSCANTWTSELNGFDIVILKKAVKKCFLIYKKFPPTLFELVDLCMEESGVPSIQEVINLMTARDFSHPLVKMIYDKIGSWTLSNGKEEEIHRKVKEHYTKELASFHVEPKKAWAQLESFKEKQKLCLTDNSEEKKTTKESPGYQNWKKDMLAWKEHANSEKLRLGHVNHPEFPANKINKSNRDFDESIYKEHKDYILSVEEEMVLTLPAFYAYDRLRLLTKIEANQHVKSLNPRQRDSSGEKNEGRGYNGGNNGYKNWNDK